MITPILPQLHEDGEGFDGIGKMFICDVVGASCHTNLVSFAEHVGMGMTNRWLELVAGKLEQLS